MADAEGLPLDLRGMVRTPDHATSVAAAAHHARGRSALQERILATLVGCGRGHGLTDEELRELREYAHLGDSTVRKRRTELYQQGVIGVVGKRVNRGGFPMNVWGVPVAPPPPPVVHKKRAVAPPEPPVVHKKRGAA